MHLSISYQNTYKFVYLATHDTKKIVFYVQNAISLFHHSHTTTGAGRLAEGDVELEIEINDENNGSYGENKDLV